MSLTRSLPSFSSTTAEDTSVMSLLQSAEGLHDPKVGAGWPTQISIATATSIF